MQRSAQATVDPQTKPPDLGCESTCRHRLQPPSPFIIITQPESWYSAGIKVLCERCV